MSPRSPNGYATRFLTIVFCSGQYVASKASGIEAGLTLLRAKAIAIVATRRFFLLKQCFKLWFLPFELLCR